jgi:hypothetical protein
MRFLKFLVLFTIFFVGSPPIPCHAGAEQNSSSNADLGRYFDDDTHRSSNADLGRYFDDDTRPSSQSAPKKADSNPNSEFLKKTISNFREKCEGKEGIDYLNCWADYSPKRCKSLVYGKDRSAWSRCVFSCGSAGFYSQTFGDCSD